MITEEEKLLLGEAIRVFLGRGCFLLHQFGTAKNIFAVLMRDGHQTFALMSRETFFGDSENPFFLVHKFLMVNSFQGDRPLVLAWRSSPAMPIKYMVFDPWRIMQDAKEDRTGDGITAIRVSLKYGHRWDPRQNLYESWIAMTGMRKKPVILDRFL